MENAIRAAADALREAMDLPFGLQTVDTIYSALDTYKLALHYGMMCYYADQGITSKCVVNTCFGGFSFSPTAEEEYARLIESGLSDMEANVQVVESMGEASFGKYAKLKVFEVLGPSGSWTIEEYDGRETMTPAYAYVDRSQESLRFRFRGKSLDASELRERAAKEILDDLQTQAPRAFEPPGPTGY